MRMIVAHIFMFISVIGYIMLCCIFTKNVFNFVVTPLWFIGTVGIGVWIILGNYHASLPSASEDSR